MNKMINTSIINTHNSKKKREMKDKTNLISIFGKSK